jgi:fucose permease
MLKTVVRAEVNPAAGRSYWAVIVVFLAHGIAVAAFISRIPALRDDLGISTGQLGMLLLCCSLGSVIGMPLSAAVVHRLGVAHSAVVGGTVTAVGLLMLAAGLLAEFVVPAAGGLALIGTGNAVWGVAMNVAGGNVERELDYPIMPRLHAAFSLGTVGGAGTGVLSAILYVPLGVQLIGIAVLVYVAVAHASRHFLPSRPASPQKDSTGSGLIGAWCERRTLLLGILVLAFAFSEGAANDWLALAMVDGFAADETVGAVAFGLFVGAMTLGRMAGGAALQRFGRVVVLRAGAAVAFIGLLLVLFGGSTSIALAGAPLWGIGTAMGFPVVMSAAADDPVRAVARISVVNSFATALIAAPPLIGMLAEHVGILRALSVGFAALVLAAATAGAARPLGQQGRQAAHASGPETSRDFHE